MNRPHLKTSFFDNFAGIVQVAGKLGEYDWFFHARGGSWRYHLVESNVRCADAAHPMDDDYWVEGTYLNRQLTNAEVSAMVTRCIDDYLRDRGQKICYRQNR